MKRMCKSSILIALFVAIFISGFVFMPTSRVHENLISTYTTGEELAKAYCASCHLFPQPALLDKTTWKDGVLPNMGWRLGIRKAGDNPYATMEQDEVKLVRALNIFPEKALLPLADWKKIVAYYLQTAPDKPLPQKSAPTFDTLLKGFHAEAISFPKIQLPQTSLLKYDSTSSLLFIGDGQGELYAMKSNLKLLASWKLKSAPADIEFNTPGSPRILCIGSVKPTQKNTGSFYAFEAANTVTDRLNILDNLARPVATESSDLNEDGRKDIIICQFGHHTGKLSWFDGGDPKKEHVLKAEPGSRRIAVRDFNTDGKPDIMALMAQGKEELILFINKGGNRFSEKAIYQFPPVYGVSYFELADFNRDGHPDILLTNGDNWDLSPVRKYYHGIRILMNDGKNNFKIAQFFPFYGASKAVARDFDMDGDLDIAAIAFFDDPNELAHTFLYLENNGRMTFSSSSTPAAENGKWITMESCDFDRDGDQDIILGSFVYSVGELTKLLTKGLESFPQLVILWNDRKN